MTENFRASSLSQKSTAASWTEPRLLCKGWRASKKLPDPEKVGEVKEQRKGESTVPNPGLIKSYNAEGGINPYTIVKFGANDFGVVAAAAATDKLIGVTREFGSASGEPIDVIHDGVTYVKLGGTVARGDLLTSDASGQAIVAAPGVGVNNRI